MKKDTSKIINLTKVEKVEMRGIVKQFPGVLANDRIDFDVRAGEVHTLLGENGAGKSTLIDIIKHVLTGKTNTYDPKLLMPDKYGSKMGVTPELYSFRGSYAAVGTEVDQSGEFSMGVIKNLTGDDTITANPKYKDQVEFDATWQLILAVNDLPRFSGTDSAFIDRLYIVPFVMTFPKTENEIENLLNKGVKPERIGTRKNKTKMMYM